MTCALTAASETSDNFAQWVPNFASSDMNQRRDAQQNWQNFCRQKGNNPEVQKEIIRVSTDQLAKDNPADTTVWIVRQLGIVGDATAVPALAKLLANNEVRIRDEAARALANIPGTASENALKASNLIIAAQLAKDALTSRTIKADIPRNDGVETAMPMAVPFILPAANAYADFTALLDRYSSLNTMEKAQVLSNLTTRALRQQVTRAQRSVSGGTAAVRPNGPPAGAGQASTASARNARFLPLALEAAQSNDETLRNAGILAVGALGGPEQVPFLLEQARSGGNKDLAKVALSRMSGQRIDALLLENLKSEENAEKFGIIADVLNRRFNSEIRPLLMARAQAAGTPNRLELMQWARPMSTKADVGEFVKVWALIEDRGQKDRAEQEIAQLVDRDAAVVMQALGTWDTPEGMSLLGRIGDGNTLAQLRQAQNAAGAFRNWPNAAVADDLLAIVRDTNRPADDRIASLRAFIRVISLPGNRENDQIGIRINDVNKVNRLAEAYELATRVDEKRLIIERVGQIRTVESLRFIMKYVDDAELRDRVCWSILDLAHQTNLRNSARAEFEAALDKVLEVTTNNDQRNRATQYKAAQ
jgi:HEAT repeat protein